MDLTDRCGAKLYVGDYFLWVTEAEGVKIILGRIDDIQISEICFLGKKKECPTVFASIADLKWNREWCRTSAVIRQRKIVDSSKSLIKISVEQAEGFANTDVLQEGLEELRKIDPEIPVHIAL
jgi:hypothetical protein